MSLFKPIPSVEVVPQMKQAFLEAYASTGLARAAADICGIDVRNAYRWRSTDPAFASAWDHATRQIVVPMLEQAAIEHAMDKSDLLLMFMLKAHKREMYDDKVAGREETHDSAGLTIVFEGTPQEREKTADADEILALTSPGEPGSEP